MTRLLLLLSLALPAFAINAHPRIWMTPTKLTALQAQYGTDTDYAAMKAVLAPLVASCDATCSNVTFTDVQAYSFDTSFALVYLMEGDTIYGYAAVRTGLQAMGFFCPAGDVPQTPYPGTGSGGYGSSVACYQSLNAYREYIRHATIVFDAVYPLLTSGQKTVFINVLTDQQSYSAFSWQKANNTRCYNINDETYCITGGEGTLGNLGGGQAMSDCFIGYATFGDNPSDSGSTNNQITQCQQRYTNEVKPSLNGGIPATFSNGAGLGVGGYWPESAEYGPQAWVYIVGGLYAMTTATGTDFLADSGAPALVQNWIKERLYTTSPAASQAFGCNGGSVSSFVPFMIGDVQQPVGIMQAEDRVGMTMSASYLGTSNVWAQYAAYWANNIQLQDQCNNVYFSDHRWLRFWFNVDGITNTDWRAGTPISTEYEAPGFQALASRSNWTSTGSLVNYFAGNIINDHQHPSVGGFTYWRNGELVSSPDIYYPSYDVNCAEHENGPMVNYRGGVQGQLTQSGQTTLNYYEGVVGTYMYAQSDAANTYAYPGHTGYGLPTHVLRDIVYLQPDFIVTWDRLTMSSGAYNKVLIHGVGCSLSSACVGGNTFTTVSGVQQTHTPGGNYFNVTPLFPSSPMVNVVSASTASAWNSLINYNPHDMVKSAGTTYEALNASLSDMPPSANWTSSNTLHSNAWSSVTAYDANNYVAYNNVDYVSLLGNTNQQPDISPTYWTATRAAFHCIGNGDNYYVPELAVNGGSTLNLFSGYHVEITDNTSDTASQYLIAMEGASGSTPTVTEKLTNGNFIAAHYELASDDKIVGFSTDASGGTITLPITYSFTAAASTDSHLITGLTPGSTVNVTRSKISSTVTVVMASSGGGTNYTASGNGVICFTSAGANCTPSGAGPSLFSISPTSGARGASVPVTLTGSNFISGASISPGNAGITVTSVVVVNPTTITATFVISAGATPGAGNVTVTTSGGTSGAVTFTVTGTGPTLTSISPTSGVQGATVPVTLTGTNFISGATVDPGNVGITVSSVVVVSSTSITANFAIAGGAAPGPGNVTVTTSVGTSGSVVFTVTGSAASSGSKINGNIKVNGGIIVK